MRAFLVCLVLLGCGRTTPLDAPESLMEALTVRGLYTYPNPLSEAPPGALSVALNAVVDRPGEASPRRGLKPLSQTFPSSGFADSGTSYQGKVLVHTSANKLAWIDPANLSGGWSELSGTYTPPAGCKMQFAESNKDLYFTTTLGLYRLDAYNGTPVPAGGAKALQPTSSQTGTTGFQAANTQVAYRVLWLVRDANNRLIEGLPSPRQVQLGTANPVAAGVGTLSRSSTTVTAHIVAHGYSNGAVIYLASTDPDFPAGVKTIASVADADHFTYTEAGSAVSNAVAGTFYYATRDNSLTVPIPSDLPTGGFAQVYRTAQSAGSDFDPGDEMGLVYEYIPNTVDIAATSFTFTDLAPDELRGTALHTNPSQGGLFANGAARPPLCTSLISFKGSLIGGCTTQIQSLQLSLLSTSAMTAGDALVVTTGSGVIGIYLADTTEDASTGKFKRFTAGTAAQNIADTAQSLARVINGGTASAAGIRAYYISGTEDPPGQLQIEISFSTTTSTVYAYSKIAVTSNGNAYWSPALPVLAPTSSLARVSNVVTINTSFAHGLTNGQTVLLDASVPALNFPIGVKTVTSVASKTRFTYTESGVDASSSSAYVSISRGSDVKNVVEVTPTFTPFDSNTESNAIAFTPVNEPDSWPLENVEYAGSPSNTILALTGVRDRVFISTDKEGMFQLTGADPNSFGVFPFDPTVILAGRNTAVALNNQVYAFTTQGVMVVSEGGAGDITQANVKGTLLDLLKANPTAVATYSFGVAYEDEKKYILYTTSAADVTKAAQAFIYNYATQEWSGPWDVPAGCGFIEPTERKLWLGDTTLHTTRQERKAGTYLDYADGEVAVTISSHTGATVVLSSATGVAVGDALVQGALIATVRAINSNTLTLSASLAWSNAAATVYNGFKFQIRWVPATFGAPAAYKQVFEADLLLGDGRFDTATLDFASDLSTSFETVALAGPGTIGDAAETTLQVRSPVPQEKAMFTRLTPQLTVQNALASVRVQGLRVEGFAFTP